MPCVYKVKVAPKFEVFKKFMFYTSGHSSGIVGTLVEIHLLLNELKEGQIMRRIILTILAIISLLLIGCSSNEDNRILELQSEIAELEESLIENSSLVVELKERVEKLESNHINQYGQEIAEDNERKATIETINLAERFVQSYLNKDVEGMKLLSSDNLSIGFESIIHKSDTEEIQYNIIEGPTTYRMNSFGNEGNSMFYQFLLYEEPYSGLENGFFMNLRIERIKGVWEVDSIDYDI